MRTIRITLLLRINLSGAQPSMYVCICNAIKESDLRRVARRCPGDAESCYAVLGKRPACATCLDDAEEIIFEERQMAFEPESCAA